MQGALDRAGTVDLGAQELRGRLEGFAETRVLVDRGEQVRQFGAVAAHQVVQPVGVEAVFHAQAARLVLHRVETVGTQQRQLRRHRGPRLREGLPQGEVDGVLGHHPVGGELAAGDGHHARDHLGDGVFARDLRRLRLVEHLRLEQRPQPGVGADDVVAGQRRVEDLVGVIQHVVDILGGRHGVFELFVPGGVGGADHPVVLPRDDEQHRLLGAQEQASGGLEAFARDDDVDSLAGEHLQPPGAAREVLGLFGPHAGGVDDPVGLDGELVAVLQVDGLDPAGPAAPVLEDLGDLDAAGSSGPVLDGGADQRDHEAGVVDSGVVELDGAD